MILCKVEEVFQRFRRLGRVTVAVHATSFHFCTAGAAQRLGDRAGAGREVDVVARTAGIAEAAVAALDGVVVADVGESILLRQHQEVHGDFTIGLPPWRLLLSCHALG